MPKFDIIAAKRDGLSDEQITAMIEEARAGGVDLYIDANEAQRAQSAKPDIGAVLGASVAHIPGAVGLQKTITAAAQPVAWLANEYGQRAAAASAQVAARAARGEMPFSAIGGAVPSYITKALPPEAQGNTGAPTAQVLKTYGFQESPVSQPLATALNYTFGRPVGNLARFATSPEGVGLAAEMAATAPMDVVGGGIARAAGAATRLPAVARSLDLVRQAPVVKQVGNTLSRGFSLPYTVRQQLRDEFALSRGREAMRNADLGDLLDEAQRIVDESAKARGMTAEAVQDMLRDAVEKSRPLGKQAAYAALTPDEAKAADILVDLNKKAVAEKAALDLRRNELGAHATAAVQKAEQTGATEDIRVAKRYFKGVQLPKRDPAGAVAALKKAEAEIPEYLPRVELPELSKARTGNQYSQPIVSGLSTGGGLKRRRDVRSLAADVEAGVQAKYGVKRGFAPAIEAQAIKSKAEARRISNAELIDEALKVAGGYSGKDAVSIPTSVLTGFTSKGRRARLAKKVHPEVARWISEFQTIARPEQIKGIGHALEFNKKYLIQPWKKAVTSANPQFTLRNQAWNVAIGWFRGNRDPRNYMDAATVVARDTPQAMVRGLNVTRDALRREMIEHNIIQTGTVIESGSKTRLPWLREWQQANSAGEDVSRASYYIHLRRGGMDAKDAMREVQRTYFNYTRDAFTPELQFAREHLVPFLAWKRNVIPLAMRSVVENPGAYAQPGVLANNINAMAGLPPEAMQLLGPDFQETMGVVVPPYPERGGTQFKAAPFSGYGFSDVSRTLGGRGRRFGPGDEIISSAHPVLSKGLQALTSYDAFRGRQMDGRDVKMPSWVSVLPLTNPKLADRMGIRISSGQVVGPDWIALWLSLPGPFANAAADLSASGDPQARQRALRWLSSINVKDVDIAESARIQRSMERAKFFQRRDINKQNNRLDERLQREKERATPIER